MMKLVLLALIAVIVLMVWYVSNHLSEPIEDDTNTDSSPHECQSCSTSGSCIAECTLRQAVEKPLYFDDEELDDFRGRPSDGYSEQETELFADILYTMKSHEVSQWLTSLSLRGISLPDALKPEAEMMMSDNW